MCGLRRFVIVWLAQNNGGFGKELSMANGSSRPILLKK
jgi:hypothetical protein